MQKLSRRAQAFAALLLAVVLFVSINIFTDTFFTTARIDLTANGQFTLAQGTRNIIAKLDEPITLRFYYSKKTAAGFASTNAYADEVRNLLVEYAALSHGKIVLQEVDPEPYTPEEDEATAAGLTGAPTDSGDTVYFGLAGTNSLDGKQVIPYFTPDRESYLEYDLTSLIYRLSTPKAPVLGIISSIPIDGSSPDKNSVTDTNGATGQPVAIYTNLKQDYKTVNLGNDITRIPADVDVLMIVHPYSLPEAELNAIDQFVLDGGRALVFVDPISEVAGTIAPGTASSILPSDLGPLLKSWGVDYSPGKVLADKGTAQSVQTGDPRNPQTLFPLWLHVTSANFNSQDLITANLQAINLASTGVLFPIKGATTQFIPLITSSDQAALLPRPQAASMHDPAGLMGAIVPTHQRYAIAARITGPAKTAFPGRGGLQQSRGPINVVVLADTDIFEDRFWMREENVLGNPQIEPFADNAAFVLDAVENLTGSQDLISLRTRATNDHPFIVVQKLQAKAQGEFQKTAETLQARLAATQQSLRELQQGGAAGKTRATANAGPTPEQQATIQRFQRELGETRAQLRDVQHNLRKDIDRLGGILAFVNIVLVPILVAGFAIALSLVRRRRRRTRSAQP